MEILKFFGLMAMIWYFVSGAAPIQFIKKQFKIHSESQPKDLTRKVLIKLVNCALCSGFWIGILYYLGWIPEFILIASFVGLSAEIFYRIIKFLFNTILSQF